MNEQIQDAETLATVCIVRCEGEITCTWEAPGFDPDQLPVAREALLQMAEKLNAMNIRRLMQKAYQRGELDAFGESDEDED